jgi:hypothetical protein
MQSPREWPAYAARASRGRRGLRFELLLEARVELQRLRNAVSADALSPSCNPSARDSGMRWQWACTGQQQRSVAGFPVLAGVCAAADFS